MSKSKNIHVTPYTFNGNVGTINSILLNNVSLQKSIISAVLTFSSREVLLRPTGSENEIVNA